MYSLSCHISSTPYKLNMVQLAFLGSAYFDEYYDSRSLKRRWRSIPAQRICKKDSPRIFKKTYSGYWFQMVKNKELGLTG